MTTTLSNAPLTVSATVNQKNLLSTMKHLFASSFSVLGELMQNARRAGATQVSFDFDPENATLTITDDGSGVQDFQSLIALCESNWSEQTTLTERPFGMGFFSVFYAAATVIIESNGLKLEATLDDIVHQRKLKLVPIDVTQGTCIRMQHISKELLVKLQYCIAPDANDHYQLTRAVRDLAMGFPIPVLLNGEVLARPHALDQIQTVLTPVGHIHEAMLFASDVDTVSLLNWRGIAGLAIYLQGLPIQVNNRVTDKTVIHLDSNVFVPLMPDRKYLYDVNQLQEVQKQHRQLVVSFLTQQKAKLTAEEFVDRYWAACSEMDCLVLMNDLPMVPRSLFNQISIVEATGSNCYSYRENSKEAKFVYRNDLVNKTLVVWRNVAVGLDSDDTYSAVLLKILQREQYMLFSGYTGMGYARSECKLDPGHWLMELSHDAIDFDVSVEPGKVLATGSQYVGNFDCDIQLVESVRVTITSRTRDLNLDFTIDNDWLVVFGDGDADQDEAVICYVTPNDHSNDSPVCLLSHFEDEDDHFREEWQSDAIAQWNGELASMQGSTLGQQVALRLYDLDVALRTQNVGQLAVLQVVTRGENHHIALQVTDLEKPEFWSNLTQKVLAESSLDASKMRQIFSELLA